MGREKPLPSMSYTLIFEYTSTRRMASPPQQPFYATAVAKIKKFQNVAEIEQTAAKGFTLRRTLSTVRMPPRCQAGSLFLMKFSNRINLY